MDNKTQQSAQVQADEQGIPVIYRKVLQKCINCGKCKPRCSSLSMANMTLFDIALNMQQACEAALQVEVSADEVVAAGEAPTGQTPLQAPAEFPANQEQTQALFQEIASREGLIQAVRGCFFCKECIQTCDAHIDVCSLIYQSRELFNKANIIDRSAYASVQVDNEWHIFSAYKAVYGITYSDLERHIQSEDKEPEHDCEVAFFPGCSLAAYSPELTRAVFADIDSIKKATLIDACCGSPLKSAGFLQRAANLEQKIIDELISSGAKEVVCPCPGCANMFNAAFAARGMKDYKAISLAKFLLDAKREPIELDIPARFFKSCQDRDASCLRETQKLINLKDDKGSICHGCCGAGGAVSAFAPNQQEAKVKEVLEQVKPGQTLISMCPTCTYTQNFQMLNSGKTDIEAKNYLELYYDCHFDWSQVFANLQGMYTGEYAQWVMQVLS